MTTVAEGGVSALWLWIGVIASSIGLALFVGGTIAGGDSPLRRAWNERAAKDDAELRFVRARIGGDAYLALQVLAMVAGAIGAAVQDALWLAIAICGVVLARVMLARRRAQRIATIEGQLETWLGSLANALRSTPSLGEALAVTTDVVRGPIAEEVDTLLKQTRLGLPLDRALLDFSDRIASPLVTSALAALLVGRQTGGDLPAILEETSAGLREMTRLQGVLDAKTSESRMQAYVMLAIPFVVLFAIHRIDSAWLEPLSSTTVGLLATLVAAGLWLAAVVLARRILDVSL
ncbi:type II secretion system F family protein [Sandaracinus amylolyticus]|uniref:type II secretion system F family protein n=1 Tax=Sandaracinus amylolyticus TaxID=927083 RepID=UPI001F287200|nr:type II secretion system F family protein [Sandaracinus amylolyticus]UJR79096.1 Flp pilus assembly protein TadB [Sandaracinus amylolyticus]